MNIDEAFDKYFSVVDSDILIKNTNNIPNKEIPNKNKLGAFGNIENIEEVSKILRIILNSAWGENWGKIKPEIAKETKLEEMVWPVITYDVNSREVTENTPIKPQLSDTIPEIVNGVPTGDCFLVYRQWFDNIIEFNIWGRNSYECSVIANKFEKILNAYTGYLKKIGVSEMFFLKEIPRNKSVNYLKGLPMKALMFYFKFERVHTVRESVIKNIDVEVEAYLNKNNKDTSLIEINENNNTSTEGIVYEL